MRYALVSDIHSNLPAWNAVLADLTALKVKKIICLGDVIGYGPQPEAVLESAYKNIDYFVMGNHDAVVAGKMSDGLFNDVAQAVIRWTADNMSPQAKKFLAEQPLVLKAGDFICTHGSLDRPQAFNYVLTPQEALDTWNATDEQLVFIGHSHIPAIFVLGESGTPHLIPSQDFMIENGKRYIVNVGSVGDPRDDDVRASYCIYDDYTRTVTFRRIPFDYEALRAAAKEAHLEDTYVPLLSRDKGCQREAVRESLGFEPPTKSDAMAQNVVLSGYVGTLRKTNTKLKIGISAAFAAFMAAAGVATSLLVHNSTKSTAFPGKELEKKQIVMQQELAGNLLDDFPAGPVAADGLIYGWRYFADAPALQTVSLWTDPDTGKHVLTVTNQGRHKFILEAPDWELNGYASGRVQVHLKTQRDKSFQGKAAITVIADKNLPEEEVLISLPLSLKNADEWTEIKRIMEKKNKLRITKNTKYLSYRIEADFSGSLSFSEPSLNIKRD